MSKGRERALVHSPIWESPHLKRGDVGHMYSGVLYIGNTCMYLFLLEFSRVFPNCPMWSFLSIGDSPLLGQLLWGRWWSLIFLSWPYFFLDLLPEDSRPAFLGSEVVPGENLVTDKVTPSNPISWFCFISRLHCSGGGVPFSTCMPAWLLQNPEKMVKKWVEKMNTSRTKASVSPIGTWKCSASLIIKKIQIIIHLSRKSKLLSTGENGTDQEK